MHLFKVNSHSIPPKIERVSVFYLFTLSFNTWSIFIYVHICLVIYYIYLVRKVFLGEKENLLEMNWFYFVLKEYFILIENENEQQYTYSFFFLNT